MAVWAKLINRFVIQTVLAFRVMATGVKRLAKTGMALKKCSFFTGRAIYTALFTAFGIVI